MITSSCRTEGVLDVRCHSERNIFGHAQLPSFLEAHVVVDVNHLDDYQGHYLPSPLRSIQLEKTMISRTNERMNWPIENIQKGKVD